MEQKATETAPGVHRVTPHLVCNGAADAIDFYKDAFGATEMMRLPAPNGKLMHACVCINGSSVMLVDENPMDAGEDEACRVLGPRTLKGTPVTIHLIVDDVDAFVGRAVAAGAALIMPVADMFWGDRYGKVKDPFGYTWGLATRVKEMTKEEVAEAGREWMAKMAGES